MGKSSFLRNSHDRITVLNQFCSPKVLGLVEMTSGLLNATFSFPEAVKLTFFAVCTCMSSMQTLFVPFYFVHLNFLVLISTVKSVTDLNICSGRATQAILGAKFQSHNHSF